MCPNISAGFYGVVALLERSKHRKRIQCMQAYQDAIENLSSVKLETLQMEEVPHRSLFAGVP